MVPTCLEPLAPQASSTTSVHVRTTRPTSRAGILSIRSRGEPYHRPKGRQRECRYSSKASTFDTCPLSVFCPRHQRSMELRGVAVLLPLSPISWDGGDAVIWASAFPRSNNTIESSCAKDVVRRASRPAGVRNSVFQAQTGS